jgi:hypothetical protein
MTDKYNRFRVVGDLGQWLSVLMMAGGVVLLCYLNIDSGTILFSSGCLVATLATKVKYYGGEYVKRNSELVGVIYERRRFKRKKQKSVVVDDSEYHHYF